MTCCGASGYSRIDLVTGRECPSLTLMRECGNTKLWLRNSGQYIRSSTNVWYKALDRQSTSSWALAPIRNPPPGVTPFAKFSANGFDPISTSRREAASVVSFVTWTTVSVNGIDSNQLSGRFRRCNSRMLQLLLPTLRVQPRHFARRPIPVVETRPSQPNQGRRHFKHGPRCLHCASNG
jgi:hypothetical protein